MRKLGVSIYPDLSTPAEDKAYLDLAARYGFKRVFTSLLQINGNQDEVISEFQEVIQYAKKLGMEVMVDMNPALFPQLGISYDDLSFFNELGAYGVRLDLGFSGIEEARMSRNPYGVKIEINMSSGGTKYIDNIMSFHPNRDNLMGSHNFYPHRYTGLSYEYFLECSKKYRSYNLHTAAFINAPSASYGPWPVTEGLCTLEMHRTMDVHSQTQHLLLTDLIDDILIADAYASEEDLVAVSRVGQSALPLIRVKMDEKASDLEREVILNNFQTYRGDRSEYMIRSSLSRVKYKGSDFPPNNTKPIKRGDILIDNNAYEQYKGETQIALRDMENFGSVNVVGHIVEDDLIYLDSISPFSDFQLIEVKN